MTSCKSTKSGSSCSVYEPESRKTGRGDRALLRKAWVDSRDNHPVTAAALLFGYYMRAMGCHHSLLCLFGDIQQHSHARQGHK
jgi:hypothetical protein